MNGEPKGPPATSAIDLEGKRKAVIMIELTRFMADEVLDTGRFVPTADKWEGLADLILERLHHHECWGEFKR